MNSIKVEIFYVKRNKGIKSYELNLSKNARIHSIFDIFLSESVDPNTLIQEIFHYEKQKEKKFEVEKILNQKGN